MDRDDSLEPKNSVDILLNHQTQRLEDIANNAVDFIRINLIILGAFVPFLSAVITDIISPELFIESRFSNYIIASWIASTLIATFVYRFARTRSMSHFDVLEQAVVNDWREADLRDEMIDNNDRYDRLTSLLMIFMTISIALSIMTILFMGVGLSDLLFEFPQETEDMYLTLVIIIGATVGVGIEAIKFGSNVANLLLVGIQNAIRRTSNWTSGITNRIKQIPEISSILSVLSELLKTLSIPITNLSSIINQSIRVMVQNPQKNSETYDDYGRVFEDRNTSPIRIRLLRAIHDVMGLDSWKFEELTNSLGEEYPDIGVTRGMIRRLQNEGYIIQKPPDGPSTLLIREQQDEVINPNDLQDIIMDEVESMIEYVESEEYLADIVASEFGVPVENLDDKISEGEPIDQLDRLNSVVDRISEDKNADELPFGKIRFIQRPNEYRLTPKALQPFAISQLEEAKQALEEGYEIQALLLASSELELYLKSIAIKEDIMDDEEALHANIRRIMETLHDNGYVTTKEFSQVDRLRNIRNEAAHPSNEQLETGETRELLSFVEDFIRNHT